jgi:hypothetical protein
VNAGSKSIDSVYQLTGVSSSGDATQAAYTTRYFVPHADYDINAVLNTSSIVKGYTDTSLTTRWDPSSATAVSNYGATEELAATCAGDPGAGNSVGFISTALDTRSCNNRIDMPHIYTAPGVCFDQSTAALGCGNGQKPSSLAFASPGDKKTLNMYYGASI